ncbi:MAG: hypothetical protein R2873_09580 [Caldilineaceae bacterium]
MNIFKSATWTKILAVAGTWFVWFPILATLVLSAIGSWRDQTFRFDFLMPAELFPVAVLGGALLLWAAYRAHELLRPSPGRLVLAVAWLAGGQLFAVVTGLASGETEPVGWLLSLALSTVVLYTLSVVEVGVTEQLTRGDLFAGDTEAAAFR